MALPLTKTTANLAKQINVEPNIVLEIDGIETIFGAQSISEYIRIGDPDLYIGEYPGWESWVIGGVRLIQGQSSYLSFNNGGTTRLTQKLDVSRAQGSSVTQFVVTLIDKNEEISRIISPGQVVDDVLYRDCVVRIGFKDSAYPQDYNVVFRGVIQSIKAGAGYINLILSASEAKKIPPIFPKVVSKSTTILNYRSGTLADIFYENRDDVTNLVTVTYVNTGVAGSENVIVVGTNITVQMQTGASTARMIKKAIEEDPDAHQLVNAKITGDEDAFQSAGSVSLDVGDTVDVEDGSLFKNPTDILRTFIKIGDEMMEYTNVTGDTISGITRGSFDSIPFLHEDGEEVQQVFQLEGNPIDIALKVMLSRGDEYYKEDVKIKSIVQVDAFNQIPNGVMFDQIDIFEEYGVAVEDLFTIEDADIPGNNVVDSIIVEAGYTNDGTYIVLADPLSVELTPANAVGKFKSQFNTLPVGMGMKNKEVDIRQHQYIRDTFLAVNEIAVVCTEEKNGKDWIEQQLYLPAACFSVPRKGRSSIAYHIGPLSFEKIVLLSTDNVPNAKDLVVERSTSENFANTIRFLYDYDPVSGEYLTDPVYESEASKAQVKIGEKNITIESRGVRTNLNGANFTAQSARRLLSRYQYGAEYIKGVKVLFGDGYAIEIGDIVAVDFADLQLTDFKTGTRLGEIRLMECLNKTLDSKNGDVTVDLVNTVYNVDDRFGVISPSSRVGVGSTTTKVILKKTFSTKSFQKESLKWDNQNVSYIGQDVIVHNEDWSIVYETTIQGFDNNDPQGMLVDPPLSTAPGEEWVVCCPNYPTDTDPKVLQFWKNRHAFFSHSLLVASGSSQTVFTLAAAPANIPFKGSYVRLHNDDFSAYSPEVKVTDITGLVVTVDKPLGFVPNSTHRVELIGFPDKGSAYRII
jgi:hypothetical protein